MPLRLQGLFAILLLCLWSVSASAADSCLDCHLDSADHPVNAILHTPHASLAGGGSDACMACHGSSASHVAAPTNAAPDLSFGPRWPLASTDASGACLGCHAGGEQMHWAGSSHESADLACSDCHTLHRQSQFSVAQDPATTGCLNCHSSVRAELRLPSRHPIAEGKTECTDCHNPHGSSTPALLRQVTLNDNCLSCHSEKRGPFLWEHPPASEDCSLCHQPHGSVHDRLLTARGPALCQQCHAAAFHPSLPYGAEGLAGGSPNQNVLGKNCLNCHGQVHGSNHPSGARLTR
ncbi:DmsE family decaheme c-type cytochrome [Parahaliea maris]|uniref:DmsE family decaheme c-type cytochrome n=1 Tax=Parahaliea maris TaxID=2716870 RepID=A0A5C9A488_9GAMM|nr:DmsE family decaheme c-type cytochrome [Parahaliea maris]TXS95588.1 DmsE family decaheme c-type cytochrome [Parahaliea maris]